MKILRYFSISIVLALISGCSSIEKINLQESGLPVQEKTSELSALTSGLSISLTSGIIDKSFLLLPEGEHRLYVSYKSSDGSASASGKVYFDGISKYEMKAEKIKSKSWRDQISFVIKNADTDEILLWK